MRFKMPRRNVIKRVSVPHGPQAPKLLDVTGAALFLGRDERWIRRRLSRGLLPYRRFAGRIVFLRTELEQFITNLPGVSLDEAKKNLDLRGQG
jgi:hypothetical protein